MSQEPGWYPDQFDPRYERHWDGIAWGEARPRAVSPDGAAQAHVDAGAGPAELTQPPAANAEVLPGSDPAHGPVRAAPASAADGSDAYGTPTPVPARRRWGDVVLLVVGIALMVFPVLFALVASAVFDFFEDDDGASRLVLYIFLAIPALFFLVGFFMTVAWAVRRLMRRR